MSALDTNMPIPTDEEKELFKELIFAIEGRTEERNAILGQFKQDFHEKRQEAKMKFALYNELSEFYENVARPAAENAGKQSVDAWKDGKDKKDVQAQETKIEDLKASAGL